jgi:hypothetical protein
MSRLTKGGISTTRGRDTFRREAFYSRAMRRYLIQWDYRDKAGELHSGIADTTPEAEEAAAVFGYVDEEEP